MNIEETKSLGELTSELRDRVAMLRSRVVDDGAGGETIAGMSGFFTDLEAIEVMTKTLRAKAARFR